MSTLLLAIRIAEKLNRSQMKVLAYFVEHKIYEGSYGELAREIYGNYSQYSNLRKYINQLAKLGLLAVDINNECNCFDGNRTYIALSRDWQSILEGSE